MPARRTYELALEIHVLEQRRGIWCDHCALPSVIEIDWAIANHCTLAVMARGTWKGCLDCRRTTPSCEGDP